MAAQRHEPDPQQAGDGERNRGDRGGRRTFLDVDVVAARDDDAGECRRQGHSHDEHGELVHIAAHAQQQADAILAEGKAAAEAERQHKLRQADAQTTALARAMCEKLLARSLNEQDDARLLDDLLEKAGAENGK